MPVCERCGNEAGFALTVNSGEPRYVCRHHIQEWMERLIRQPDTSVLVKRVPRGDDAGRG